MRRSALQGLGRGIGGPFSCTKSPLLAPTEPQRQDLVGFGALQSSVLVTFPSAKGKGASPRYLLHCMEQDEKGRLRKIYLFYFVLFFFCVSWVIILFLPLGFVDERGCKKTGLLFLNENSPCWETPTSSQKATR